LKRPDAKKKTAVIQYEFFKFPFGDFSKDDIHLTFLVGTLSFLQCALSQNALRCMASSNYQQRFLAFFSF
jgi:hypothetical protein